MSKHVIPFERWLEKFPQSEIARAIGVSRQAVSLWVSGRSLPSPNVAAQLIEWAAGKLDFNCIYESLIDRE